METEVVKHKQFCRVVLSACTLALFTGSILAAPAHAGTKKIKGTFSGSWVTAYFSFDGNGIASVGTYGGKMSHLGSFTGQNVMQMKASGNPCTLPGGTPDAGTEFTLVAGTEADRINNTGDMIFSQITSDTSCVDFSTGRYVVSATEQITGGTGKFANATGTVTETAEGFTLAAPNNGSTGLFQAAQGSFAGTITTP